MTSKETAPARMLMPTLRRINPHAAWCSNYEFEDVIRAVDDVHLLEFEPGPYFAVRHRLARSLAWHGRHRLFTAVNPGVKPVTLDRDYDLLAVVCMNFWDLLYLNAIRDWRSRCRVKVCYIVEFYAGLASQYDQFLRLLSDFDHVFLAFSGSVSTVSQVIGKPCHHAPLAADVRRFTPYPSPPRRVIDVYSIGLRSEPVHEALLRRASAGRLFYLYDTIPGSLIRPTSPSQHRDLLANCAKRSRFFVTYEAKFGYEENQGQSEVGARYFEGTAAGAVLLGQAPSAPSFRDDFPWPDPVFEVRGDGSDVEERLLSLEAGGGEVERIGVRNAVHALRRHDWAHRWRSILEAAATTPRPALAGRLQALEALAEGATRSGERR